MSTLLIFSIVITICYLCYIAWVTGGVPDSLSATYYTLDKGGWLFSLVLGLVSLCLCPVWVESGAYQYLAFLSCGGLLFTAVAPAFKLPLEGAVHYSAAVVCCVCAVLWVLLNGMYPLAVWWGFLGLMSYVGWGHYMWWLEIAVMGMVFTALM